MASRGCVRYDLPHSNEPQCNAIMDFFNMLIHAISINGDARTHERTGASQGLPQGGCAKTLCRGWSSLLVASDVASRYSGSMLHGACSPSRDSGSKGIVGIKEHGQVLSL